MESCRDGINMVETKSKKGGFFFARTADQFTVNMKLFFKSKAFFFGFLI